MKKLILTLTLIYSLFTVNGQERLLISNEVEPFVQQVVDEAKERNINVMDSLMKRVDYIFVDYNLNYPTLGLFYKETKTVYIAGYTLTDSLIVRTAVFHEIGHALTDTRDHTCKRCSDIMSEAAPETFSIYAKEEDWEKELDKYYEYIKLKLYGESEIKTE